MPESRRRLRRMAAALVLSCATAHPATFGIGEQFPKKAVADLQLMTAKELANEARRACTVAQSDRQLGNTPEAKRLGKTSDYLRESQEYRDYLDTVLRVLRAKLGSEPLWMGEFKQAALGQDAEACSQVHQRSLKDIGQ
jgi:hypothetical protein